MFPRTLEAPYKGGFTQCVDSLVPQPCRNTAFLPSRGCSPGPTAECACNLICKLSVANAFLFFTDFPLWSSQLQQQKAKPESCLLCLPQQVGRLLFWAGIQHGMASSFPGASERSEMLCFKDCLWENHHPTIFHQLGILLVQTERWKHRQSWPVFKINLEMFVEIY